MDRDSNEGIAFLFSFGGILSWNGSQDPHVLMVDAKVATPGANS